MVPSITLTTREQELGHLVVVADKLTAIPAGVLSTAEKNYLRTQSETLKQEVVEFNRLDYRVFICLVDRGKERAARLESARVAGDRIAGTLGAQNAERVTLFDTGRNSEETLAVAEGVALGSYKFLKYMTKQEGATLQSIEIYSDVLDAEIVATLAIRIEAVCLCRDLINEPHSYLTATVFAETVTRLAQECGAQAEVLNQGKLEALKMGGLLAVNQGSHEPPTFSVMEWKPEEAFNAKPIILIGKGVMYDSGGTNLKPGNSLVTMKDDMSGAAAVAATIYAAAKAKLPVHLVGLMPATDNRIGPKALVPGDIITMHSGLTVEIIDTDAEGRLILADALSYARKYDPALVIDLATLTGSAVRAIGKYAAVAMQSGAADQLKILTEAGRETFERLVEFPMWEEYGDLMKSEIADLKNLGPPEAGSITAAKFLERFTDYPYIHLDIAGPAFTEKRDGYRGLGGTGFGVRLLFLFLQKTLLHGTTRR